jgi:hypothetical protein
MLQRKGFKDSVTTDVPFSQMDKSVARGGEQKNKILLISVMYEFFMRNFLIIFFGLKVIIVQILVPIRFNVL